MVGIEASWEGLAPDRDQCSSSTRSKLVALCDWQGTSASEHEQGFGKLREADNDAAAATVSNLTDDKLSSSASDRRGASAEKDWDPWGSNSCSAASQGRWPPATGGRRLSRALVRRFNRCGGSSESACMGCASCSLARLALVRTLEIQKDYNLR